MSDVRIYYATCFYDIGRSDWETFPRTFDDYLAEFEPFVDLFNKEDRQKHQLFVYLDTAHLGRFEKYLQKNEPAAERNIHVVPITEKWLEKTTQWKDLEKEREVMGSEEYKKTVGDRVKFPESRFPEYTMINHIKIDLLKHVYDYFVRGDVSKSYLAWVDFGFFKKDHLARGPENYVPERLLDETNFETDKVHYTVINPLSEEDLDAAYTLKNAPEKVAGYFFFLRSDRILGYHKLYRETLATFRECGYADDDQHLVIQCYSRLPHLFKFHRLPWHTALVKFQKRESIAGTLLKKVFGDDKIKTVGDDQEGSDDMLTLLGAGLSEEECRGLKAKFPNSKIYNISRDNFALPGIVGLSCDCHASESFAPKKEALQRLLKKDLKYISPDAVYTH